MESDLHALPIAAASWTYARIDLANGFVATVATRGEATESISTILPSDADAWHIPLTQLVTDPGSIPHREVLKHSPTTQVIKARLTVGDQALDVICKRALVHGTISRLACRLTGSRARRNWNRAQVLLRAGIRTAIPFALIERPGEPNDAWLVSQAIPDPIDLDQLVLIHLPTLGAQNQRRLKNALIAPLVDVFRRLDVHGLHHRDLKASNFLITGVTNERPTPCVWIVDLDGLGKAGLLDSKRRWQRITRLGASLAGYTAVTRTDQLRLLQAYLSTRNVPDAGWKPRFRMLQGMVTEYNHRAKQRKRDKLDGFDGG